MHNRITKDYAAQYGEDLNNRVLCLISPRGESISVVKVELIRETWGQRCDKLIFVTNWLSATNDDSDLVAAKTPAEVFQLLYDLHLKEFKWFLYADDEK